MDTPLDQAFDDITQLAANLCATPVSLISFLDVKRVLFKSCHGISLTEVPSDSSFCQYTLASERQVFVVKDASKDDRFKCHPLVANDPHLVYFAGVPITNADGTALGCLCVMDTRPRQLNAEQLQSLQALANQAGRLIELRKKDRELKEHDQKKNRESTSLNNIIEATQAGTWEWNVQTGELHINERWAAMIGYTKAELEPVTIDTWYQVLHPDDRKRSDKKLQQCFNKEVEYYDMECRLLHKDGHIIWINDRGKVAQWTEDGQPLIMLGTHTDITNRKQAEEALSASNQALRERVKEQECLYKITQLGTMGKCIDDLLKDAVQLIPGGWQYPEITSAIISYADKTYQTDGHRPGKWEQTVSKQTAEGKPLAITVAYHEDKPAASDGPFLKEEQQLLEGIASSLVLNIDNFNTSNTRDLILESTEEGVYGINEHGRCTFMNPSAAQMLGYGPNECIGQNMHDLIHYQKADGSSFHEKDCPIYLAKNATEGVRIEQDLFWRKDGTSIPVQYSSTPIIENGEHRGAVIVFSDITARLESEKQLQQSEQRFKALVQEGSELIAIVDNEGAYIYASPNYDQYLEYPHAELPGKNAFDFIHPDDLEQIQSEFALLTKQKRIKSAPYRFKHKNDGWRWLQSIGTNMTEEPAVGGFVINSIDITDIIQAQEELKASEARYRGFYESQTNYVLRTDMEGNYTYVNKKFIEEFGWIYPDGEILGKNCLPSICEYHHQKVYETVEKCIAKPEQVIKVEIDKPTPGGGIVTTLWDFVCIVDAQGQPAEIQCMGIDITERIQFEGALKASNERFELIMQASSECIADLDPATGELYLSAGFSRIFGIEIQDRQSNKALINSLIHPDDKKEVLENFDRSVADPEQDTWTINYRLQKGNGEYAYVKDKAIVLRKQDGTPYRVLGVFKDISTEHFYEQLESIEKEIMEYSIEPNVTLEDVLDRYMRLLEELFPEMRATVLKIENNKLRKLAAPSMPAGYTDKIDGLSIGPNAGSCGTAAYLKEKVIAGNIFEDERWEGYTDLGKQYGFAACWSQPVFSPEGDVIATLANYYEEPRTPGKLEEHAIERTQRLVSIIMAKYRYVDSLKRSNERYKYVNKATDDATYDWDVVEDKFYWGDGFQRMFGHATEGRNFVLEDWARLVHPDDVEDTRQSLQQFFDNKKETRWTCEYRFERANSSYAWVEEIGYLIRDKKGHPERMIGVLRDISQSKETAIQNEIQQDVSAYFNEDDRLRNILQRVLEYLATFGQFSAAEIWLTSIDHQHLNLMSTYAEDDVGKAFYEASSEVTRFAKGEGLPGTVWEKGQIQHWDGLESHEDFIRGEAAKSAGLRFAFGLPLYLHDTLVGVLVLANSAPTSQEHNNIKHLHPLMKLLGTEIKRKQQEEEMQLLFDSAPEILATVSPGGYFTSVNPAFCELLGYTEEELTSSPLIEFVHPEDQHNTEDAHEKNMSGIWRAYNFINRFRTKDGNYRWISWSSSKKFGEDGLVFAYGRDVTQLFELQALLDNASKLARIGAWEIDIEQNKLFWSPMTKELHEVPEDYEPNLNTAMEFYPDHIRPEVEEMVNRAITQGEPFDFELPIITAKGNERWIRAIGEPEFNEGRCTRIYGSFQDINDRKSAELELQRTLSEKNDILESIGDAFFAVDKDWIVTYWNQQAEQVLGKKRDDVLGTNLWESYADAVNLKFYTEYHKAMERGETVHFEEYYPTNNQWFEVSAYPSDNGLSVYFKDVSIRKIAEEQIRQSNERFEKIAEATNDAIWDWNIESNHLFWGEGFRKLFGYELDKVSPTLESWHDHIHPDDKEGVMADLDSVIKDPECTNWQQEYRYEKADGTYAYVVDRGMVIRDANGKATRMVGAMTDITYRREYEESLKKLNTKLEKRARELAISNQELEQFAYVASHDLQEPLRMVSSFLTQLEKKYGEVLDEKAHQYIHYAVDGAQRMRQIILDLLDFSRVGKHDDALEQVPLNSIVEEVKRVLHREVEQSGAQILHDNLPKVLSYHTPLVQILQNLISNSIKYTDPDVSPEIRISCKKRANDWLVTLTDNGLGIDPDYFDKIFVIFQRLHTKEEYSGTGMGLAIVKKSVESLGGQTWVESEPQKGSTFYFTLPILEGQSAEV